MNWSIHVAEDKQNVQKIMKKQKSATFAPFFRSALFFKHIFKHSSGYAYGTTAVISCEKVE